MLLNSRRILKLLQNQYFLVLTCAVLTIFLHSESFGYFFFQDDFFELNISSAKNLSEFLGFFKFRSDIVAYRPISLQTYYFLSNSLFGLNAFTFKLILYALFLGSTFLIYRLLIKITQSVSVSFLTSMLWASSAIHFMTFSWIAAGYNTIGTFFSLLSFFLMTLYQDSRKLLFYIFSFLVFLISIGSFEFAVGLPVIFSAYFSLVKEEKLKKVLLTLYPFLLISFLYVLVRLFLKHDPAISDYQITLSLDSAKAFYWYVLWSLNLPEEFKYQVINQLLTINSSYFSYFPTFIITTYIKLALILIAGFFIPFYLVFKRKINLEIKLIFFYILWFIVLISPALLISKHTFPMYLTLGAIGIYSTVSYILLKSQNKTVIALFLITWIWFSASTINFTRQTSYIAEAQMEARSFFTKAKYNYPQLPTNSILLYELENTAHIQALLDQNALHAIYKDETLKIYYSKKDLIEDYKQGRIGKRPVYFLE